MAASYPLDESKVAEQATQVVEAQIRVRATAENSAQQIPGFDSFSHAVRL
ncbi:MAG: hypothetical protein OXG04_10710 [Acidobacteria bacterium]|nr:hypothetical protein [Acidobacteriota bacterium]